jgi:hypothetical protein
MQLGSGVATNVRGMKTGWIHVEEIDGRWWFVDPEGRAFFAIGTCRFEPPTKDLAPDAWHAQVAARMRAWGFNWVHWGSDGTAHYRKFVRNGWLDAQYSFAQKHGVLRAPGVPHYTTLADIYDPRFLHHVERHCARRITTEKKRDRWLGGYFTDNELFFGWGMGPGRSLFDAILWQEPGIHSKRELVRFFEERYQSDLPALNRAWRTRHGRWSDLLRTKTLDAYSPEIDADKRAFLFHFARHYFKTIDTILKKHDPNHMNLGARIHGFMEPETATAMGEFVDVVSYNKYDELAPTFQIEEMIHRHAKRPVYVTEWGFRAEDAGLANTGGVGRLVKTQRERAQRCGRFLEGLARCPSCVGASWYAYVDDPPEGGVDPMLSKFENSNYGLVDSTDRPYPHMAKAIERAHRAVVRQRLEGPTSTKDIVIVCPRDYHFAPRDRFFIQRNGRVDGQEMLRAFLLPKSAGIDCQRYTFEMDFARPVRFSAWVYQVEKGAKLVFVLDGRKKTVFDLPAGEGKGTIAKKMPTGWQSVYDREVGITVPAGPHAVTVDNQGQGFVWLNAYTVR